MKIYDVGKREGLIKRYQIQMIIEFIVSYAARYNFIAKHLIKITSIISKDYEHPRRGDSASNRKELRNEIKCLIVSATQKGIDPLFVGKVQTPILKNCTLFVPQEFQDSTSHVGKGFYHVVTQLIQMLSENFKEMEVIQVPNLNEVSSREKFIERLSYLKKRNSGGKSVAILFSTTFLTQHTNFQTVLNFLEDKFDFFVGYITSSGSRPEKTAESITDLKCINLVIDYNPNSEYSIRYGGTIAKVHVPWIPTNIIYENRASSKRIAFSGILKFNRLSWILTIHEVAQSLRYKTAVKLYSVLGLRLGLQKFKSRDELLCFLSSSELGLVLLNRQPGVNDGLIGSFWDVYHSGAIPLVQFEGSNYHLSHYLIPYRDYLPFSTRDELEILLDILDSDISVLQDLKYINESRRKSDLSLKSIGVTLHNLIQQEALKWDIN